MTLFIFNLEGQNSFSEGIAIAEDIDLLWSGKDWAEFEKETGLSQAEIGGIVKEKGKLVFSIEKKAESKKLKKPIANGKDLISFIEQAFTEQSPLTRGVLKNIFNNFPLEDDDASQTGSPYFSFVGLLESVTCNPLLKSDFDFITSLIDKSTKISAQQKAQFSGLALAWSQLVRFIK